MVDLAVAGRWLRDARRSLVGWSLGAAALVLTIVATYPSIRDNDAMEQFAADLPEFLRTLIGEEFTSPAGYLNARVFSTTLPILLIVYLVGRGARAVAGDERDGRLELTLASPVTRRRFYLERALALVAGGAIVSAAALATVVVGGAPVDLGLGLGALIAATLQTLLLGLAHGAVAYGVGAGTASRGAATGVASGLAFAGWLIYGLAPLVPAIDAVVWISPWYHALEGDSLRRGLDVGGASVLVGWVLAAGAAGMLAFDRRDLEH